MRAVGMAHMPRRTLRRCSRNSTTRRCVSRRLFVGRVSLADQHERRASLQWATNFDEFAQIAGGPVRRPTSLANYGTGTPEEAAAWVNYANKVKRHNIRYWEVGNENYGTWEADNNDRPHDPVTYANRFREYWRRRRPSIPRSRSARWWHSAKTRSWLTTPISR